MHASTCAEKAKAHHAALKENINKHFWNPKIGRYDYIVYPDGKKDTSQEESGNTFAVLFNICPNEQKKNILSNLKTEKYGMVSISPPFDGLFSKEHPGRHCNLIWPFLNSFYIRAAAENKQLDIVTDELRKFSTLVENSGYTFFEVYNPYTGKPDGGWQLATHWPSVPDQTWSATGYIASIIHGIFGISIQKDGISIFPCVPEYMRDSQLCNIVIRNITLSITTKQYGARIKRCRINHEIVNTCFIPFSSESQNYFIELEMEP